MRTEEQHWDWDQGEAIISKQFNIILSIFDNILFDDFVLLFLFTWKYSVNKQQALWVISHYR